MNDEREWPREEADCLFLGGHCWQPSDDGTYCVFCGRVLKRRPANERFYQRAERLGESD